MWLCQWGIPPFMTMFNRENSGSISGSRGTHYFGDRPQECMVHTLCFAMLVDCISSLYMLCVFVFFSSAFLLHLKLLYFVYVFFVFLCCISSVLGFLITLNLLNSWRSMSHPQEGTLHSVAVRNMACRKYAIASDPKSTRSGEAMENPWFPLWCW